MSADQRRNQQQQQQNCRHWSGNRSSSGNWRRGESYAGLHQSGAQEDDREELEIKRLNNEVFECENLFKELSDKLRNGVKRFVKIHGDLRRRHGEIKAEAKALEEEKKAVLALKLKTEKELQEVRSEREQRERASTDIAIQLAELKKTKREIDKRMANQVPSPEAKDDKKPAMENPCQQNLQMPVESSFESQQMVVEAQPEPQQQTQPDRGIEDVPLAKRMKVTTKPAPASKNNSTNNSTNNSNNKLKLVTIESALQEDAPGLYELLEERGLLDDMDVIAGEWIDDSGESSSGKDENYMKLGEVISKHWRLAMSKDVLRTRAQPVNNSKPNYCLPCLASLIEQTRIFKQRRWPVKWGWCRPLNAFLFVFDKHNRIVVERPEYGFATYFFELVQSVPVKWQVDRLIQAMSCITNCRAALLENRPLETSLLLPEEASVLEHYGWTPNTGIATLLNFCDRVLHDYKVDDDAGEWRSRIGRLLMDGHDQSGSMVVQSQPSDEPQHLQLQLVKAEPAPTPAPAPAPLMIIPKIKQESCC